MVKVSVIIPVYNTERYLEQCVESVLGQTLSEIEIILVDNGSTDRSSHMIDEYQAQYPDKVKAIHTDIADLSSARNTGLENAGGEFIAYLDSDDWVHNTLYEKLYNKALQGSFEMVVCDMFYVYPERSITVSSGLQTDAFDESKVHHTITSVHPAAWNKLFRRSLLMRDVQFTPFIYFEDFEFLYRLYPHIHSIGVVNEALIYYRQREGSITHMFDERLYAFVRNFDNILASYHQSGYHTEYRRELEYLYVRYSLATMIKRMSRMKNHKAFLDGVKFAQKSIKENFPGYRKNALFYRSVKGIYLVLFSRVLAELVYVFGKIHR